MRIIFIQWLIYSLGKIEDGFSGYLNVSPLIRRKWTCRKSTSEGRSVVAEWAFRPRCKSDSSESGREEEKPELNRKSLRWEHSFARISARSIGNSETGWSASCICQKWSIPNEHWFKSRLLHFWSNTLLMCLEKQQLAQVLGPMPSTQQTCLESRPLALSWHDLRSGGQPGSEAEDGSSLTHYPSLQNTAFQIKWINHKKKKTWE